MDFDRRSFCRTVNENGRGYQHRAMELIRICTVFSVASEQSLRQIVRLQSVLKACDTALAHAGRSRKKLRGPTDQEIENAIRKLHEYERDFHADNPTVETRMTAAANEDRRNGRRDRINASDQTLRVVQFHILRSLPDENPIVARQALISTSGLPDILWYFSHFEDERRLTLAQNPHFYGPPTFPTTYGPACKTQPTEDYQGTIYVLTNNERRVFLELGQNRRTFDNVWRTNNTLIFKDVIGRLEGEDIVGRSIPPLPLIWSRMEHPDFQLEAVGEIEDWKAPILDLWNSPHTRIHIRPSGH